MIQARLNGLLPSDFDPAGMPILDVMKPPSGERPTYGPTEIRDARELRVKESDRVAAVSENLRRMGVRFEEREDGWKIPGQQQPRGAELESFGDHRIAMAFSIAALKAQGDSLVRNSDAVAVSFPEFYSTLESVVER